MFPVFFGSDGRKYKKREGTISWPFWFLLDIYGGKESGRQTRTVRGGGGRRRTRQFVFFLVRTRRKPVVKLPFFTSHVSFPLDLYRPNFSLVFSLVSMERKNETLIFIKNISLNPFWWLMQRRTPRWQLCLIWSAPLWWWWGRERRAPWAARARASVYVRTTDGGEECPHKR